MNLVDTLTPNHRLALDNVRAAAERIWKIPLHRTYTDHTVAHSERVIALLDGLTAGMMGTGQRLVPGEVFVLLAAAYLHDVGMQDERFANGDLEAIREAHHEVTAEWIYRTLEAPETVVDLGLPDDPGLVEAVALVAKAHRRVDLSASDYEPFAHGGETVRPRLLAALLRFGDELDIDHRRVDLELLKLMAPPVESQLHWWKCHYVSGVSIVNETIRIAYRFPRARSDYVKLIIPLVETEVREKLEELEEIFRDHAVKVALGKPQVRMMRTVRELPPEVEKLAKVAPHTGTAGDYVDQPPGSSKHHIYIERAGTPPTAAGTGGWNTAAIRELLSTAFSDGELTTLCFDHFHAVYENFSMGMSKGQKILLLLDYCVHQQQLDQLVQMIKQENAVRFAQFESRLKK
jgi:hypothetical protein